MARFFHKRLRKALAFCNLKQCYFSACVGLFIGLWTYNTPTQVMSESKEDIQGEMRFEIFDSKGLRQIHDMDPEENPTATPIPTPEEKKHVIILAYMRGGSTFTSELFRRNNDSFYWFEPIDSIYSSIYGTKFGHNMPTDVLISPKGGVRNFGLHEQNVLVSSIKNILECNMEDLATEIITHSFVLEDRTFNFDEFRQCFAKATNVEKAHNQCARIPTRGQSCWVDFLAKIMKKHESCSDYRNQSDILLSENFDLLDEDSFPPLVTTKARYRMKLKRPVILRKKEDYFKQDQYSVTNVEKAGNGYKNYLNSKLGRKPLSVKIDISEFLSNRSIDNKTFKQTFIAKYCFKRLRNDIAPCIQDLEATCRKRTIRTFKAIRLTMNTIEELLKVMPKVKVIHLLRDPRGILNSRKTTKNLSRLSNRNIFKDAKYLCQIMLNDIEKRLELEKKYPNTFLTQFYEDLVFDTSNNIKKTYDFLGMDVPYVVEKWFNDSSTKDSGAYQTFRSDPKLTATKWTQTLSKKEISEIDKECQAVYEKIELYEPMS